MADDDSDNSDKLEIDWLKTLAGALAAVSTAVLLSTLGAAGTLIGAALGSVVVTVTSALYGQGLARSRRRVAQVQETALFKVGVAQSEVRRAARRRGNDEALESHLQHADERLDEARADLDTDLDAGLDTDLGGAAWGDRLRGLPWRRIAIVTAGLFVAAMVAISAFEVLAGRTVSSYTGGGDSDGGTSITRINRDDTRGNDDAPQPQQPDDPAGDAPSPAPEPTDEGVPSEEPSTEPSAEPSAEPSPELSAEPSPEPSEEPAEPAEPAEPTPTPVPTPLVP